MLSNFVGEHLSPFNYSLLLVFVSNWKLWSLEIMDFSAEMTLAYTEVSVPLLAL